MILKKLFTFSSEFTFASSRKWVGEAIKRYILVFILIAAAFTSFAEGTKQLRPTSSDFGFLQIYDRGRPFATYNAPAMNRLYVHICTAGEIIYFGFNQPDNDVYFRLKDPNGNIVLTANQIPSAGAGFITNYNQAVAGPSQLVGAAGYNAMSYTSLIAGDYYFEFNTGSATTLPTNPANGNAQRFFDLIDITVATGAIAKPGRLWSYSWDINTKATTNPFEGKMYILSTDSIVTSIDFNGMQPFGAVIAANSTGLANSGNLIADRKSKVGNFSIPEYKIFLNDPDDDCYPTGSFGNIVGQPIVTGCDPANRCINIAVNKPGKVEIVLDLNGTFGYQPNTSDLLIIANVVKGSNCIPWDSKDGLGNFVTAITGIPLEISYLNGVTHLPLYDVEANPDGYIVDLIRPAGAKPNLYWDDSAINKGTALDGKVNLTGCSNASGCHRWEDRGDNASAETINTWWYPNIITKNLLFDMPVASVDADNRNAVGALNDSLVCEKINSFKLSGTVGGTLGGSWTGGSGTFSPSRNVVNPTYVPSQAERNAGAIKLYLTSTPNGSCPPAKDSVKIVFEKAPVIVLATDKILCSTTQTIPVTAIVTNATTGLWTGGNGGFTSAGNQSTTYNVTPTDITAGNINLIFTSTGTRLCPQEDDTINVSFEKPPIVKLPADKTICVTGTALPVTATLTNALTGIWKGGNGTFATSTNTSTNYTFSAADITAGNINLIYTTTGARVCPQEDDTINLTLNTRAIIEVGSPKTICEGTTTVNITATGDNTSTLTWTGGNGTFAPNNALTTTYTLDATEINTAQINLTLTAQKGVCPDSSDVLSILITPLPSVHAGKDTLICKTTNFNLIGSGTSNALFKWYAIPSQTILSLQNTATISNIQAAGDYVLEASIANNCSNTDTVSIQVYDLPTLSPGGPYCLETGLTLQANATTLPSVPSTYIWSLASTIIQSDVINPDLIVSAPGSYTLTFKTDGCSKDVLVKVNPKPVLTSPDTLASCEGSMITLYTNAAIGSTYSWYNANNSFIQNGATTNIVGQTTPNIYFVHELDANGCTNKDSIVAVGTPIPLFNINNAEICVDSIAHFEVITTNIPSNLISQLTYEWKFNGNVISTSNVFTTNNAGTYSIKASLYNCPASDQVDVVVHDLPTSSLPAQYVFCPDNGTRVELNAGNGYQYHWNQTNETTQTISVATAGTYEVLVYNSFMCKTKATTVVKEECKPSLFISNAFSPNGDNINDFYETFDNHVGAYSITIFNRWGEVIFQSTDKKIFWDGYYKGEVMPVGVYPYVLKYEGDTDTYKGPYTLEGSVTLVK